jgi:hypothetical protein
VKAAWRTLGGSGAEGVLENAVKAANLGKLVVAGYRQPAVGSQTRSGHIVIVRPQNELFSTTDGPLVTMAGDRNWRSIHMRGAFHSHPTAWPSKIQLFAHDTDLEIEVASVVGVT